LLSWYSEGKVSSRIRDGSVAMDLLKPYDFQKAQLAGSLGGSITEIAVSAAFCVVLLPLFGGVSLPPDPLHGACFLISLAFSYVIKFGIVYIFGLLCFYTTSSLGIRWARGALTDLFSGALIPITFFPGPMLALSRVLPFQGVVFIPVSIYTGTIGSPVDILRSLAFQAVWAVALWVLGKLFWRAAIRQVTILGG
jgi:ABC-2 type transport system permease protein